MSPALESFRVTEAVADEVCAVLNTGRQVTPFSERYLGFDLDEAYRVAAAVRARREMHGEKPIGRKIGFTNRTIWAEYKVYSPIWGYVYDSTVHDLSKSPASFELSKLAEPRIEPEIIFGLVDQPQPNMNEMDLIGCIGWIAHGFEIVQSIFPGWSFTAADTVAGYGLHGALLVGVRHPITNDRAEWCHELASFEIDLFRDGTCVDHGRAANVLDGPLLALKHLVGLLAADPRNPPLEVGEIITTGTLTRAFPISPEQLWATSLSGLRLQGISIAFKQSV